MAPDDSAAAVTDSATDDFVTGTEAALPEVPLTVPGPESPESPESSALANLDAAEHSTPNLDPPAPPVDPRTQLRLRNDGDHLVLLLPSGTQAEAEGGALGWGELLHHFKQRLNGGEPFWQPNTVVHLAAHDRLIDARQLQALDDVLTAARLTLKRVVTSRRQTAMAAVTVGYSVEQLEAEDTLVQSPPAPGKPLAEPLYLRTTVRGGVEIRHPGTIVVMGDVNPGSALVAGGDILVWGRLRGTAHAGFGGDRDRYIMALYMQPTQLRLADLVARAPDSSSAQYLPEVAYVGNNAIRIAQAQAFARQHFDATLGQGAQPTDAF